jgi:hypothetical protein
MVDITSVSEAAVGETITILEGLPEGERSDALNEMLGALRAAVAPQPEQAPPA